MFIYCMFYLVNIFFYIIHFAIGTLYSQFCAGMGLEEVSIVNADGYRIDDADITSSSTHNEIYCQESMARSLFDSVIQHAWCSGMYHTEIRSQVDTILPCVDKTLYLANYQNAFLLYNPYLTKRLCQEILLKIVCKTLFGGDHNTLSTLFGIPKFAADVLPPLPP